MSRAILVIKLSSLGDVLWALPALRALRAFHRQDRITLLTTAPYEALLRAAAVADEIWLEARAPWWQLPTQLAWRRRLRRAGFARVYDLQWSQRSESYFRFWPGAKPEWVGITAGASHFYAGRRAPLPIAERQREMLALAGITSVPANDLSFLHGDLAAFSLPARFALLVPGSSPHRQIKRWPAPCFAEVARWLLTQGITPVLLGGASEKVEMETILTLAPGCRDLSGQTSLGDLAELGRQAEVVIGNDTGPFYIAALAGAPAIALYCQETDPTKTRPPGDKDIILREAFLKDLAPTTVLAALETRLAGR